MPPAPDVCKGFHPKGLSREFSLIRNQKTEKQFFFCPVVWKNTDNSRRCLKKHSKHVVAIDRTETQQRTEVEANVDSEQEIVRKVGLAETRQAAGRKMQKKASRNSQQARSQFAPCKEEEIPRCNGKKRKQGSDGSF